MGARLCRWLTAGGTCCHVGGGTDGLPGTVLVLCLHQQCKQRQAGSCQTSPSFWKMKHLAQNTQTRCRPSVEPSRPSARQGLRHPQRCHPRASQGKVCWSLEQENAAILYDLSQNIWPTRPRVAWLELHRKGEKNSLSPLFLVPLCLTVSNPLLFTWHTTLYIKCNNSLMNPYGYIDAGMWEARIILPFQVIYTHTFSNDAIATCFFRCAPCKHVSVNEGWLQ